MQDSNNSMLAFVKAVLEKASTEIQAEREIMNKAEAAEYLRISVPTLERFAFKLHEIPYSKPSKHAVFLRRDLLKWLHERRIPSVFDQGV